MHALTRVPDFPDPELPEWRRLVQQPHPDQDTNTSQYESALTTCRKLIPRVCLTAAPAGNELGTYHRGQHQRASRSSRPRPSIGRDVSPGMWRTSCARRWRPSAPSSNWHSLTAMRMLPAGGRSARTSSAHVGSRSACSKKACLALARSGNWGRSDPTRSISRQSPPTSSESSRPERAQNHRRNSSLPGRAAIRICSSNSSPISISNAIRHNIVSGRIEVTTRTQ